MLKENKSRELNWVYNKESEPRGTIGMLRVPGNESTFVSASQIAKEIGDNISHSIIPVSFVGTLEPYEMSDPSPFDGTLPEDICRAHASKISEAWRNGEDSYFIDFWIKAETVLESPLEFNTVKDLIKGYEREDDPVCYNYKDTIPEDIIYIANVYSVIPEDQILFLNAQNEAASWAKACDNGCGVAISFHDSVQVYYPDSDTNDFTDDFLYYTIEYDATPDDDLNELSVFVAVEDQYGHSAASYIPFNNFLDMEYKTNFETLSNIDKDSFSTTCSEITYYDPEFGIAPEDLDMEEPEESKGGR